MFKKIELTSKTLDKSNFIDESMLEIPLVGRSNVGKSTFLNKLLKRKIAKVSKTPGRTRSIDFYLIDDTFYIVDLPGFGYARVGRDLKGLWKSAMGQYFERNSIKYAVHLIDASVPAQPIDLEVSAWIQGIGINEILLFTKIDKVGKSKLFHQLNHLSSQFHIQSDQFKIQFSKNFSEAQILELQQRFYSILGFVRPPDKVRE